LFRRRAFIWAKQREVKKEEQPLGKVKKAFLKNQGLSWVGMARAFTFNKEGKV